MYVREMHGKDNRRVDVSTVRMEKSVCCIWPGCPYELMSYYLERVCTYTTSGEGGE